MNHCLEQATVWKSLHVTSCSFLLTRVGLWLQWKQVLYSQGLGWGHRMPLGTGKRVAGQCWHAMNCFFSSRILPLMLMSLPLPGAQLVQHCSWGLTGRLNSGKAPCTLLKYIPNTAFLSPLLSRVGVWRRKIDECTSGCTQSVLAVCLKSSRCKILQKSPNSLKKRNIHLLGKYSFYKWAEHLVYVPSWSLWDSPQLAANWLSWGLGRGAGGKQSTGTLQWVWGNAEIKEGAFMLWLLFIICYFYWVFSLWY